MNPREGILRRVGHRYQRVERFLRRVKVFNVSFLCEPCAYCGMPMQALDHVPPLSRLESLDEAGIQTNPKLYPTCNDCNTTLGSRAVDTIRDRGQIVLEELTRRLIKQRVVKWEAHEIEELGPNMQREVRAAQARWSVIEYRVNWAQLVADGVSPLTNLEEEDRLAVINIKTIPKPKSETEPVPTQAARPPVSLQARQPKIRRSPTARQPRVSVPPASFATDEDHEVPGVRTRYSHCGPREGPAEILLGELQLRSEQGALGGALLHVPEM